MSYFGFYLLSNNIFQGIEVIDKIAILAFFPSYFGFYLLSNNIFQGIEVIDKIAILAFFPFK